MRPLNYTQKDRETMHTVVFDVNKYYLHLNGDVLVCAHYDKAVIRECITQNGILNVTDHTKD